jgi:hypothetical protein
VANFLTKFSAAWLEGSNHLFALLDQPSFEQVKLGGLTHTINTFECDEHQRFFRVFF